jgi:Protein of unknown function (DUF2786)
MGKNNRQRRAAKQRARHRRTSGSAKTGGRAHQPAAEGTFARGESSQNDNPFSRAEASPNFEQPYRQQAERSLERLLRFRARAPLVKHVVEQELVSLQLASLHAMDELITRRLLMAVAALWEHGWQPLDLVHVVRKAIPRSAQLIAAVITEQARAVGAEGRAPREWLDQLRAVAEEAGDFAPPRTGQHRWLLIETMTRLSYGLVDAWADVVVLAGLVSDLPMLEQIAPPPSSWGTRAATSSPSEPDSDRHKLLNRIRALLAKAEATSYAAEAETFTAKAQDLMTRHAIDEALLAGTDEEVAVLAKRVHLDSPYASTKASLLNVVGAANRCKVIYSDRLDIATVVGVPVDVDQVEMLFTSLLIQATRAMAEAGAARPGSFDRSATFRRSFLTAYAVRIGERLTEANTAATESYGKELVPLLTRQQDAVKEEFDRLFPNTRALSGGYLDRRGWEAGRRAADRAYFTAGRIPA